LGSHDENGVIQTSRICIAVPKLNNSSGKCLVVYPRMFEDATTYITS